MNRIIFLLIFFISSNLVIAGNDITYYHDEDKLTISGNHIEIFWDGELVKSMDFVKSSNNKMDYYCSIYSSDMWLVLESDELFLVYDGNNDYPIFRGSIPTVRRRSENLGLIQNISSTSYLKEGKTVYLPSNLGSDYLETPWVEGVSESGIGEILHIGEGRVRRLFFSNGFVSYRKPYLYERNGRVKKIKITDLLNNIVKIVELKDTPNPQMIDFGDSQIREIEIEILDIYKGTYYEDTCVNFIMVEYY